MTRLLPPSPIDLSWDHNSHYHSHVLRHVPAHATRALDVGCGAGRFARALATRGLTVDAMDADPGMIERARAWTPGRLPISYQAAPLEEAGLEPRGYDFVSALASIHHMPFGPALDRLAAALAPGGTLAVLGLYREESYTDLAASLAALPPQWLVGFGMRLGRAVARMPDPRDLGPAHEVPVRDPGMSMREIGAATAQHLPGARLRRMLFWRYSLVYTRPD